MGTNDSCPSDRHRYLKHLHISQSTDSALPGVHTFAEETKNTPRLRYKFDIRRTTAMHLKDYSCTGCLYAIPKTNKFNL